MKSKFLLAVSQLRMYNYLNLYLNIADEQEES